MKGISPGMNETNTGIPIHVKLRDGVRYYRKMMLLIGGGVYLVLVFFMTYIYSYLAQFSRQDTGTITFFLSLLASVIVAQVTLRLSTRQFLKAAQTLETYGDNALSVGERAALWKLASRRPIEFGLLGLGLGFIACIVGAAVGGHWGNGIILGGWAGLVLFLFNYNAEVSMGEKMREAVLALSPSTWASRKFGIRAKITVLGIVLTLIPTVLLTTLGVRQGDVLIAERETEFIERARFLAATAESLISSSHEMLTVTDTLKALGMVYGGDVVLYDIDNDEHFISYLEENVMTEALIVDAEAIVVAEREGFIRFGGESNEDKRFFYTQLLVSNMIVGFVVTEEIFAPLALSERAGQVGWVGLISFLFAAGIGFLLAGTMASPITKMVNHVRTIAKGDLRADVFLATDDEIEDLATGIQDMAENLRIMVGGVKNAAQATSTAMNRIAESTKAISEGAENQSVAVEETTASLTMMDGSIRSISENLQDLSLSASEGSSSVLELGASVSEVADSADHLSNAVESSTTAIEQMARNIISIAENVDKLRVTSENSSSSMVEMDSTIQTVGKAAREASELAKNASTDAAAGAKSVLQTKEGITHIRQSFDKAESVIENLGEKAERIDEIVSVINHVAEETTLLALNAAIIAAQAGERGRGFGIVAGEIKALAERTGNSTKEIAEVIRGVQTEAKAARNSMKEGKTRVEEGVKLAGGAGDALDKILTSIQDAAQRTESIARATEELSRGSEGVVRGIENTTAMVKSINTSTQEQSRGSEHISREADKMRQIAEIVKRTTKEQEEGSRRTTESIESIRRMADDIANVQQEQASSSKQVLASTDQIRAVSQENKEIVRLMEGALHGLATEMDGLTVAIDRFIMSDNGDDPNASEMPQGEAELSTEHSGDTQTQVD